MGTYSSERRGFVSCMVPEFPSGNGNTDKAAATFATDGMDSSVIRLMIDVSHQWMRSSI